MDGIERALGEFSLTTQRRESWLASAAGLSFGRLGSGYIYSEGNHFHGKLDDVRYYNQALNADEVASLYNGGNGTELSQPYYVPGQASLSAEARLAVAASDTPTLFVKDVDYTPAGQISRMTYGNGVTTVYVYDDRNLRLKRMKATKEDGSIIQDLRYLYDAAGNITKITDAVYTYGTREFEYDHLNRLIKARGYFDNNGTQWVERVYAYDKIGNILEKDGLAYSYGEANACPHAVTRTADSTGTVETFTYDFNV